MTDTPAFRILTAPRVAPLCDHLIMQLRADPLPPREVEIVVVEGQGMARWLTLQLADGFGCVGSIDLPFPARFAEDINRRVSGDGPALGDAGVSGDTSRFSREVLAWRVDALLRDLPAGDPVFEPLRTYLGDGDDRMRFGLASRIADRFSDYQNYRADVLQRWETCEIVPGAPHAAWQRALWRALCAAAAGAPDHQGRRLKRTIDALRAGAVPDLPPRVTVFAVSALAPLFIELLAALARYLPVTVYAQALDAPALHPLAKAFGGQSADILDLLAQAGGTVARLRASVDARPDVLHTLQRELESRDEGEGRLNIAAADASLRIHAAPGLVRQLEVLRDQLLAALAADPSLRPHDMLLVVPDVSEWGPLVDAVFGVQEDGVPRLPYRLAHRTFRRTEPAAEAFSRLLALQGGRFARSEVFGLLATPLVRQAAGLSETDIEKLETLSRTANIRWGYDADSRKALGLPGYDEASWRAGLDRLLLGHATGSTEDDVLGVLPVAGDTVGETEALAKLARWVDDLALRLASWKDDRSPAEWSDTLLGASRELLRAVPDDQLRSVRNLERKLRVLGSRAGAADYGTPVSFGVVRDWLDGELDGDGFGSGPLGGGVTVAALKPMHGIPFRVIAVAGLDDATFPRHVRQAAFDLLEQEHRLGDRDLRRDDRQEFLDLLLAAGDRLVLAYSGRDVADNASCAPSVVIDELLDHLDRRVAGDEEAGSARRRLVVEHPLQPFSPRYFSAGRDERLFTYSRAQAQAARATAIRGVRDLAFVTGEGPTPTSPDAAAERDVSLRHLVEFWANPSRFYCRRVLGFSLPNDADPFADEEVCAPDALTQGFVRAKVLRAALAGAHEDQEARVRREKRDLRRLQADGLLPPGTLGSVWHRNLATDVDEVIGEVLALVPDFGDPASVSFAVVREAWRLTGRIDALQAGQRVLVRAGGLRLDQKIRCWVEHVAMCAAREAGVKGLADRTLLVGRKAKGKPLALGPVKSAGATLASLVDEMTRGLSAPAPFFPEAGWAWFSADQASMVKKAKGRGATAKDPIGEAVKAYRRAPSRYSASAGDGEDAYIALCFRGIDPFEERTQAQEFVRLAKVLFEAWPASAGDA